MSVHRSIARRGIGSGHRNVLTRTERIAKLDDEGRWTEENNSVFALPKVRSIKLVAGKKASKKKKDEEAEAATAEGEAAKK